MWVGAYTFLSGFHIGQPFQELEGCLPERLHGGDLNTLVGAVGAPGGRDKVCNLVFGSS